MKYFTGSTYEETLKDAAVFFGLEGENADVQRLSAAGIVVQTVQQGGEALVWTILAIENAGAIGSEGQDGYFKLYFEEAGVFLELYPPFGKGYPVIRERVTGFIARKKLRTVDSNAVSDILDRGMGRARITGPQLELVLDEEMIVTVAPNRMEASVRFLPGDEPGKTVELKDVFAKLAEAGVVYGIKTIDMRAAVKEKNFEETYIAAEGTPAADGSDGRIEYHFRITTTRAPREISDDGKVDFRDLDLFEPVGEGQLLVTRVPPTAGTPGKNVKGDELSPKPGKNVVMPKSRGTTVNEDGTKMFAATGGMASLIGGTVVVSDTYVVNGDCDMGVGNIKFAGNVEIRGSVTQNLTINAAGNITVDSIVEGATLIAGRDILLKRGIMGNDRGSLTAGGSIKAQFIERATVAAGVDVSADTIIHSIIEAGRSVVMEGKRMSIMGGSIRATGLVSCNYIGSVSGTLTEVEVGVAPKKRQRMKILQDEVADIAKEIEELEKKVSYLEKGAGNIPEGARGEVITYAKQNLAKHSASMAALSFELDTLKREEQEATHGKVHVLKAAYPGVRITIASGQYKVAEELQFSTFKFRDGAVSFFPCEISSRG